MGLDTVIVLAPGLRVGLLKEISAQRASQHVKSKRARSVGSRNNSVGEAVSVLAK